MESLDTSVDTCDECPERVLWRRSATTGEWAAVNAEPSPQGNILITPDYYFELSATARKQLHIGKLHTFHRATCAQGGGKDA